MVNSRQKGARAEREVADIFRLWGYLGGKRGQQRSGLEQADVIGGPDGYHFEVKRVEQLRLWAAWEQATRDAGPLSPVVVTRRSNSPWLAVLRLDDFLALTTRIQDLERALAEAKATTLREP